ncbi:hypothetical protein HDK64DRAFT_313500 [Phyllosticta capitalensis]
MPQTKQDLETRLTGLRGFRKAVIKKLMELSELKAIIDHEVKRGLDTLPQDYKNFYNTKPNELDQRLKHADKLYAQIEQLQGMDRDFKTTKKLRLEDFVTRRDAAECTCQTTIELEDKITSSAFFKKYLLDTLVTEGERRLKVLNKKSQKLKEDVERLRSQPPAPSKQSSARKGSDAAKEHRKIVFMKSTILADLLDTNIKRKPSLRGVIMQASQNASEKMSKTTKLDFFFEGPPSTGILPEVSTDTCSTGSTIITLKEELTAKEKEVQSLRGEVSTKKAAKKRAVKERDFFVATALSRKTNEKKTFECALNVTLHAGTGYLARMRPVLDCNNFQHQVNFLTNPASTERLTAFNGQLKSLTSPPVSASAMLINALQNKTVMYSWAKSAAHSGVMTKLSVKVPNLSLGLHAYIHQSPSAELGTLNEPEKTANESLIEALKEKVEEQQPAHTDLDTRHSALIGEAVMLRTERIGLQTLLQNGVAGTGPSKVSFEVEETNSIAEIVKSALKYLSDEVTGYENDFEKYKSCIYAGYAGQLPRRFDLSLDAQIELCSARRARRSRWAHVVQSARAQECIQRPDKGHERQCCRMFAPSGKAPEPGGVAGHGSADEPIRKPFECLPAQAFLLGSVHSSRHLAHEDNVPRRTGQQSLYYNRNAEVHHRGRKGPVLYIQCRQSPSLDSVFMLKHSDLKKTTELYVRLQAAKESEDVLERVMELPFKATAAVEDGHKTLDAVRSDFEGDVELMDKAIGLLQCILAGDTEPYYKRLEGL